MAVLPTLLRRVQKADMPDADWAATQVAPSASICANVQGVQRMGVMFVAYAGAVVSTGTVDLQLVDVATTTPDATGATKTLVKASPVDSTVGVGAGLEYDVSASRLVTIRVAAESLAVAVTHIDIYWNALE
jgi:hypothetical protein